MGLVALATALIVAFIGRKLRMFAVQAERGNRELEAAIRSRENLVRGITHDLKNPLQALSGHAELLEAGIRGRLNANQLDSVIRIRRCAADELALINDLLDASQAEVGLLKIALREVDIELLIDELIMEQQPNADASGHLLEAVIPAPMAPLLTDPQRVKQVLTNVVSNAIKYSDAGSPIVFRVEVDAQRAEYSSETWLAISVSDHGPGIPEDMLEKVFEEFSRLERHASKPGSGLGLSIARRIARLLGGDLEASNRADGGSVFTLWLPQHAGRRKTDTSIVDSIREG